MLISGRPLALSQNLLDVACWVIARGGGGVTRIIPIDKGSQIFEAKMSGRQASSVDLRNSWQAAKAAMFRRFSALGQ